MKAKHFATMQDLRSTCISIVDLWDSSFNCFPLPRQCTLQSSCFEFLCWASSWQQVLYLCGRKEGNVYLFGSLPKQDFNPCGVQEWIEMTQIQVLIQWLCAKKHLAQSNPAHSAFSVSLLTAPLYHAFIYETTFALLGKSNRLPVIYW